jgi:hypothetical protein
MDMLKITPPFFYSYQCGSTLLTSYIPVYMYSISLQILFIILLIFTFIIVPKTTSTQWFLKFFPGVCWPSDHWNKIDNPEMYLKKRPIRLINPHQIISMSMNNVILLLSFGLCSPVLCTFITLSICVNFGCWFLLISRFVCVRIGTLPSRLSSPGFYLRSDRFALTLTRSQDS